MKHQFSLLIATIFLAITSNSLSQPQALQPGFTSTLTVSRVEASDEKTPPKPVSSAKPGDVLEYSATYSNAGKAAVERVQAVVPIPLGTVLLADSARPSGSQATVDGVNFSATPLKRVVKLTDGKNREELVPLAEYRAVRWSIGTIAPSQNVLVSLRVKVLQTLGPDLAKP